MGEINITQHSIDLIPGARPFKSAPYRAGPKTRELEQFEIEKQLKAGVIELSNSEWAAPVLFAPKKDGRLRFCICLLYTSPSPRDLSTSRMPSSA